MQIHTAIKFQEDSLPPQPITLFTRSLEIGGAERQLVELAKGLQKAGLPVAVVTFYPNGKLDNELLTAGVPLRALNKKSRWDIVPFFLCFCRYIRKSRTEVLYTFLGVPSIVGILARFFFPRMRIIWGVRASNMDLSRYDWLVRLFYSIECRLSRYADLIVANSEAGKEYALANGFPANKTIVIPNGIDIERFKPDTALRDRVRAEWAIQDNNTLIGIVARLDPMKDHALFIQAAGIVSRQNETVRFVIVGDGPRDYKDELRALADRADLGAKLIWAGTRNDMTSVYNGLDILVSSSCSEGFPNVIAEAMSCGVPCVATNAGDSRFILGDTGFIVPSKEPEPLAQKLKEMIGRIEENKVDRQAIRKQIVDNYSTRSMVERTITAIYHG